MLARRFRARVPCYYCLHIIFSTNLVRRSEEPRGGARVFFYPPLWFLSTGTPRPGTCPSLLLPPPGPCVSDSDECMLDVDCDGSTKKCCYNNCFKVCVEPGTSAIQGNFFFCVALLLKIEFSLSICF